MKDPQLQFTSPAPENLFPLQLQQKIQQLHLAFSERRLELLAARKTRSRPHYLSETREIKNAPWKVAPIPTDLLCRRVEITGPVHSAKMVIQMLSRNESGVRADTAMLDFEDSLCPTWENILSGYNNLIGALRGDLQFVSDKKTYQLNPRDMAHVMARVRGLHLQESNLQIDGEAISAGLLDFTVCLHHALPLFLKRGMTPKFYVPKCEHYLEARWWNDLLNAIEELEGVPQGTVKVTFLIETLPAAFQMEEILYELRERIVALNVGRWDKIFSDIKTLGEDPHFIMRDRALITMKQPWMKNYAERLVKVCHSRGALAIGGMAAFTPGQSAEIRAQQEEKVYQDKCWEAELGHDGCWVSHPYFIGTALRAFQESNQLQRLLENVPSETNLLPEGGGPYSMAALQTNIRVGIGYLHGWLQGSGCVAIDNLMEDLATLEISRMQVWQWRKHKVLLDNSTAISDQLIQTIFAQELTANPQAEEAAKLCQQLYLQNEKYNFLSEALAALNERK